MSELPITFPAIGIGPSHTVTCKPGSEDFVDFRNERDLTRCSRYDLERDVLVRMQLLDSAGRGWRIRSVKDLDAGAKVLCWFRDHLRLGRRIELDIVEADAIPFEAFKNRLCQAIQDDPLSWRDDEAIAGEAGPPRDEHELLEELKAKVRGAETIAEIIEITRW